MLDLIIFGSILQWLAAGAAIAAVVFVAYLFWDDFVDWFRQFSTAVESNPNLMAISVAESMQSGNYKVVQGIYNKKTEKMVDARRIVSKDIDEQLKQTHSDSKVVVYL